MKQNSYDDQTRRAAVELATSVGLQRASDQLGLSRSTVRSWMTNEQIETAKRVQKRKPRVRERLATELPTELANEINETAPVSPPLSLNPDQKDLAIASLKRQLANVAERNLDDVSALWRDAEKKNSRKIAKLRDETVIECQLDADRPIGLVFMSDFHITSGCTDLVRLREDGETIADTEGCYALLCGDYIDNHIKHRSAIVTRGMAPSEEMELFDYWLSMVQHRVICMVSGNHDMFTRGASGMDPLAAIAARNQLYYTPDELNLHLTVGQQPYHVMIRHQTRHNSQLNPAHGLMRHLDWTAESAWDIGCAGHHHTAATLSWEKQGKTRVAVRPGSYQISSSHARMYGYQEARPYSPMVIVWPHERIMLPIRDVRWGVQVLTALRHK